MRSRVAAVALVGVMACGGADPSGAPIAFPGSVTSIVDGREIAVVGFLVDDGESVRVCEALAESFPPQCGRSYATIVDLDSATVDGISESGGVRWTDFPIELLGETTRGSLRYLRHVRLAG